MRSVRPRVVQAAAPPAPAGASLFAPTFPAPGGGGTQDLTGSGDTGLYVMSTGITILANGSITGILFYCPTTTQPTNPDFSIGLWLADPTSGIQSGATLLAQQAASAPTAGQAGTFVTYALTTPQAVTSGQTVYPVVRTNAYAVSSLVFSGAVTSGSLRGVADGGTAPAPFPNGAYEDSGASTDPIPNPKKSFNSAFYGVDVAFVAA